MNPTISAERSPLSRFPARSRATRVLMICARVILGAAYIAGGLVPFIHWAPLPVPSPAVGEFTSVLADTRMLVVSKVMEVVFGAMLVLNIRPALAVAVMLPVLVFIMWVDWYLHPFPGGIFAVGVLVVTQCYLAYQYRRSYRELFQWRIPLQAASSGAVR